MRRRWRVALTAGVLVALFVPVALDRDGLPLSTYPMYARTRSDVVGLVTANAIDSDGERIRLSLATIGSSDDPLIVAGELRSAVRSGRADQRCTRIASRVASDPPGGQQVVEIEIVTERHDTVERTAGRASLLERSAHARCDVDAAGSS